MSDEIRKEEVDITTAEDPIESIERTVEELKQKIYGPVEEKAEEISEKAEEVKEEAAEKVEEIKEAAEEKAEEVKEAAEEKCCETVENCCEAAEEVKEAAEEKIEEVKAAVEEAAEEKQEESDIELEIPEFIQPEEDDDDKDDDDDDDGFLDKAEDMVKETAEKVISNPGVQKAVSFIKDNAMKAKAAAEDKFDDLKKDEKFSKAAEQAGSTFKTAADFIKDKAGAVTDAITDGTKKAVTSVDGFINRPDVQEKIEKARTAAADTLNKGISAVKDLLGKKDSEE